MVDTENLDGLLRLVSLDEIAAAWCRYHGSQHDHGKGNDDPDWWAVDLFFTTTIFEREELYRALLLKIADHATKPVLGALGAGPLENFMSDEEDGLRWLESNCGTNPKLRIALAGVWCSNDVSPETMARLDAAAGVPLARLTPRED